MKVAPDAAKKVTTRITEESVIQHTAALIHRHAKAVMDGSSIRQDDAGKTNNPTD
jgi:hypothetical protein